MPPDAPKPRDAVIVSCCRTPVGRYGGALAGVRPDDLAALVIAECCRRAGLDPTDVEDVVFGAANQAGEDNRNVARMAALLAGLPESVPGQTVNRLCGSGLQAVATATHAIWANEGDVFVVGGVESMSRAPLVLSKPARPWDRSQQIYDTTLGWRFPNPRLEERFPLESMGQTGENVAEREHVSRERQDAFAARSQRRWAEASQQGWFRDELVAVPVPGRRGEEQLVDTDEFPRPETTPETLAKLKPAFRDGGTVTAGNSSGVNDGAAALVLCSRAYADEHSLPARARVLATAVAGVDPRIMGLGPVPAIRKALGRAGLSIDEIDLVELNEAFAAQALACADELGIDEEQLNVTGGSIAMGHPLGSTGARLATTLVHNLERLDGRYGIAALCIGVGQGISAVLERET